MSTSLTSKGQVTIPKPIRDRLGLKAGSRIDFVQDADGEVRLKLEGDDSPAGRIARVRGTLAREMTTDEFMLLLRGDD